MKQEIAICWSEALLIYKINPGYTPLKVDDTFSILGVLCDLSQLGRWFEQMIDDGETFYVCSNGDTAKSVLPAFIMYWADMKTNIAHIDSINKSLLTLSEYGMPIADIAELIKLHWEEL